MKMRHRRRQTQRKVGFVPMLWKGIYAFLGEVDSQLQRAQERAWAALNRKP